MATREDEIGQYSTGGPETEEDRRRREELRRMRVQEDPKSRQDSIRSRLQRFREQGFEPPEKGEEPETRQDSVYSRLREWREGPYGASIEQIKAEAPEPDEDQGVLDWLGEKFTQAREFITEPEQDEVIEPGLQGLPEHARRAVEEAEAEETDEPPEPGTPRAFLDLAGKATGAAFEAGKEFLTTPHPDQETATTGERTMEGLLEAPEQTLVGQADFWMGLAEGAANLVGAEDVGSWIEDQREKLPEPNTRAGQLTRMVSGLVGYGKALQKGMKAWNALQSAVGTSYLAGRGLLAAGERITRVPGTLQALNAGATGAAIGALRSESGHSSAEGLAQFAGTEEGQAALQQMGVDDPQGVAESLKEIAADEDDRRLFDALLEGGAMAILDAGLQGIFRLARRPGRAGRGGEGAREAPGAAEAPARGRTTAPGERPARAIEAPARERPGRAAEPPARRRPAEVQPGPGPERPGDLRLPGRRPEIAARRMELPTEERGGLPALPGFQRRLPPFETEGIHPQEPAVIRLRDPQNPEESLVFTGVNHAEAAQKAIEETGLPAEQVYSGFQGFQTTQGRIVDRREAEALATEAGQLREREMLDSETVAGREPGLGRDLHATDLEGNWEARVERAFGQGKGRVELADEVREANLDRAQEIESVAMAREDEELLALAQDRINQIQEGYRREIREGAEEAPREGAEETLQLPPAEPTTKPQEAPEWGEAEPVSQYPWEGAPEAQAPRQTFSLPRESIGYAPEVFQFKVAGPQAEGEALLGRERWSDLAGGTVKVWYWENPKADGFPDYEPGWYVVDGHNRLRFAQQLAEQGHPTAPERLNVMEIDAANPAEARAMGAFLNMMAGRGTAVDAAKFFRDSGMGPEDLTAEGIGLTETVVDRGLALAELPEPVFRDVATGGFPMRRAVIIGESDLHPDLMMEVWKYARSEGRRELPDAELGEFIEQMKHAGTVTEQTPNLDMFGADEMKRSLMKERAKIIRHVREEISRDRKLMQYVTRAGRARRLEETGAGEIEEQVAEQVGDAAAQYEALFNARAHRKGDVSQVVNKYAKQLAEGERPANAIKEEAHAEIKSILEREAGQVPREGAEGAGEVGRGPEGEGEAPGQGGLFEGGPRAEPGGPEAGVIEIDLDRSYTVLTEKIQTAADKPKSWIKRHFTVEGDLPPPVFRRKIQRDTWVEAEKQEMEFAVRDFKNALREVTGSRVDPYGRLSRADKLAINEALHGQRPISDLPEPLQGPIKKMRADIDAYSNRLIEIGAVQGPLAGTVSENLGVYLHRSYRVFDQPEKWRENIPEDVWNKAYNLLRSEIAEQNPGLTEQELYERTTGLMDHLLAPDADGPLQFFASGQLGKKDLSILTRRKDIAPEIRALMGEYKDPIANYVKTYTKQMHLVANHQFLSDVLKEGMGRYFFTEPRRVEGVSYSHKIAAEGSKVMEPLNGIYTTEEIATAFREAVDPNITGTLLRRYMKVNAAVKGGKTVGNPVTHARNFTANVGFVFAAGNNPLSSGKKALTAVTTNFNLAERLAAKWGQDIEAAREYYMELQRLGVVSESARFGELRDIFDDATERGLQEYMEDPSTAAVTGRTVGQAVGAGMRGAQGLYRAEDDFWKIINYEAELAKYRWAYENDPSMTEEALKQKAAQVTRDVMPTYSMVPRSVRKLRRLPMVGTFPSFTAEVFRNGKNLFRLTAKELRSDNPRIRAIGARRLAGMITVALAIPAATLAGQQMLGIGSDDDDRIRRFLPPWSRHSNILYLGRDDEGRIKYVDLSYTDPFADWRRPINALMAGEDWETALLKATWQTMEPFLGPEILWDSWNDVVYNTERETGRQIYNPTDDPHEILLDGMEYALTKSQPGIVAQARRIANAVQDDALEVGVSYDLSDELLATLFGIRISRFDPSQALSFKLRDRRGQLDQVRRQVNSVIAHRGEVSEQELREEYRDMEERRRHYWEETYKDIQAMRKLDVPTREIRRIILQSDFSREDMQALMDGRYIPYKPSPQFFATLRESFEMGAGGEGADAIARRREIIEGIFQEMREKYRIIGEEPE